MRGPEGLRHTWSAQQDAEGGSSGAVMKVAVGNWDFLCKQWEPLHIIKEERCDHLLKIMGSYGKVGLRSVAETEDLERRFCMFSQ